MLSHFILHIDLISASTNQMTLQAMEDKMAVCIVPVSVPAIGCWLLCVAPVCFPHNEGRGALELLKKRFLRKEGECSCLGAPISAHETEIPGRGTNSERPSAG